MTPGTEAISTARMEEKMRWVKEQLAYCEREGLVLETERLKQFLRKCALELREMETISNYRKDERIVPTIQIQPRSKQELGAPVH